MIYTSTQLVKMLLPVTLVTYIGNVAMAAPLGGDTLSSRHNNRIHLMKEPAIDVQAHRGGTGLMPENTVASMLNAVKLGVKTLELDCSITADKKVVVSHDPYMSADIMLKPDGSPISKEEEKGLAIYKMPYDSVRSYQAGVKPHPVHQQQAHVKTYKPLLSELIDSVEAYVKANHLKPVCYNMETKCMPQYDNVFHPAPDEFVKLVMEVLKEKGIQNRVIIQSFDVRTLQILHKHYPAMQTSLLVYGQDSFETQINKLGFYPTTYSPYFSLVTPELVKAAHTNHVTVLPWTVNKEEDMKQMATYGVDGIISDYPDKLIGLFGNYQRP
ncbi:glycerophosphoryl diester phosphodiesterase [Filimonas zeae]|nr:glycerophosphodiester phosphodiesterase family protein [Filimonas zeae]MDR6341400.1 glycerophosphoryl diester phosphodiesterase [Filimonas zeae]